MCTFFEGNQVFFFNIISNCNCCQSKQIIPSELHTCSHISELPSTISTMDYCINRKAFLGTFRCSVSVSASAGNQTGRNRRRPGSFGRSVAVLFSELTGRKSLKYAGKVHKISGVSTQNKRRNPAKISLPRIHQTYILFLYMRSEPSYSFVF